MGIAFLSRERGLLKVEAALQSKGHTWQMMVVRGVRMIGVYATPRATAKDWREFLVELKRFRRTAGKTIMFRDLDLKHGSWGAGNVFRGGRALLHLIHPLQINKDGTERPKEASSTRAPFERKAAGWSSLHAARARFADTVQCKTRQEVLLDHYRSDFGGGLKGKATGEAESSINSGGV